MWKDKELFWQEMRQLAPNDNQPWVCVGDFNDITRQNEKQGGRYIRASGSQGLQQFMQTMGFVDLGLVGARFTWCNKRPGMANIRERLDRGISNVLWRFTFPNAAMHHYPITNSDHVPLVLYLFYHEPMAPKPFKFELLCTRESSCYQVVADAWTPVRADHPVQGLFKKIRAARYALRKWNKEHFGNIQDAIDRVKEQLGICQQSAASD